MREFDLLAFDWDGTLYDSTAVITRCIRAAVEDVGQPVPTLEQASFVIGMGLPQALAHVAPGLPPAQIAQVAERYRHHYRLHVDDLTLFDGVLDLLHRLKATGVRLAVATGKSRRGLDEVLVSTELAGLFDDSRTADQTASKPDPLMLHQLMQAAGVSPDRCLMVGDTSHDLLMARYAGCPAVAVTYGAHPEARLHELAPRAVCADVPALAAWLLPRMEA